MRYLVLTALLGLAACDKQPEQPATNTVDNSAADTTTLRGNPDTAPLMNMNDQVKRQAGVPVKP